MTNNSGYVSKNWPWLVAALIVIATHLSVTFLTTLAAEDWRQCFDASGVYRRAHKFPIYDYPWRAYWGLFAWSVASTVPGVVAIVLLRSPYLAILCLGMLAPLMWNIMIDFHQMAGEYFRGEVVTAQGGYHDCDRKGNDGDLARFWLYLTSLVVSFSTLGLWWFRRRRRIPLKS